MFFFFFVFCLSETQTGGDGAVSHLKQIERMQTLRESVEDRKAERESEKD